MHPAIAGIMATQHGLVTRRQAIEAGLPPERVDRLARTGAWVTVRRGVYVDRELWASLSRPEERQLARDRAASLRISRPHVMSHDSAALELRLDILRHANPMTHVTRPGIVGSHLRHGVKHHLAPYPPDQVVETNGRRVLGPARTAADIAREHGLQPGVVAFDSAYRHGCTAHDLDAACAPMTNWPNVTTVRAARRLADPGAESVGETLARLLVTELGLGRPETQFGLTDGLRTVWCDLRIGRQVIEFDGRLKYLRRQDGGVATVDPREVLWAEKQRQDWVCGFKLGMSRVVWDDLWGDRRRLALLRLRRECAETAARFGTSIEDLAPYVVRSSRRSA
ncbi:type IV toxin-antitoxin system AbiEi family antitoxin domain-containing protein [Nocardioides sp.]|uniref:type IV toxin-antitoxin system AbiEi family antitoxin domain-containing protein n=1 Tax=Nocardioides sp. TaxID=35761 RepID=UPI002D803FD1|nr:type IV toxin-antitoxin system AbiEi family antitoxin domain-containing protein [Nocardioides sp.]HET8961604.1 type IV toxin-antitoxin system AbiEi family antitoxin domain-containing protein [Nocardioides sp.]